METQMIETNSRLQLLKHSFSGFLRKSYEIAVFSEQLQVIINIFITICNISCINSIFHNYWNDSYLNQSKIKIVTQYLQVSIIYNQIGLLSSFFKYIEIPVKLGLDNAVGHKRPKNDVKSEQKW